VTGGAPPVSTVCTPASGSRLPVGATTIACAATDAQQRTASCSFVATVRPPAPATLTLTRFTAFGDSITEGKDASGVLAPLDVQPCSPPASYRATAYPNVLQTLLTERYTTQASTIAVHNRGCGGERAADAMVRFQATLTQDTPQVLLLMEGSNDLNDSDPGTISVAVQGLRSMVQEARRRGIAVFLATVPPQRVGGFRARGARLVPSANESIRTMATAEGAILVDVYNAAFAGSPDPFIDFDGLHPRTPDGHRQIAQAFYTVLVSRLETPRPTSVETLR